MKMTLVVDSDDVVMRKVVICMEATVLHNRSKSNFLTFWHHSFKFAASNEGMDQSRKKKQ